MQLTEVLKEAARVKSYSASANVVVTGSWAWTSFKEKPSDGVRNNLKAHGWKYQCKSKKWYLAGHESRRYGKKNMGWEYIINKYGVQSVEELQSA